MANLEHYKYVCQLLRLALGAKASGNASALGDAAGVSAALRFPSGVDWTAVIRLATEQGVGVVALDGLDIAFSSGLIEDSDKMHIDFDAPLEQMGAWESLMYEAMSTRMSHEAEYARHMKAISKFAAILSEAGMKMMVFKGYDMSRHYPVPTHRPMGDVDFYAFGDGDKVDALVEARGKSVKRENPKHSVFTFKDVTFENHKSFLNIKSKRSDQPIEDVLQRVSAPVKDEKLDIYRPGETFNFIFLLRHMQSHFMIYRSIHLRHILDWGLFLKDDGPKVDMALASNTLRSAGVDRVADYFTTLAQELTGEDFSAYMIGPGAGQGAGIGVGQDAGLGSGVDEAVLQKLREDILLPKEDVPSGALATICFRARTFAAQRWKYELTGTNFFVQSFFSAFRTLGDVLRRR